jgi:hypothetical protein
METSTAEPTPASTSTTAARIDPREAIGTRVDALMLKLLDAIERDIVSGPGALPGPHVAAYEALCRAEASRLGI